MKSGRFQAVRGFIIATSLVWLGCFVIFLWGLLMDRFEFFPVYGEVYGYCDVDFLGYLSGVFSAAIGMFMSLVTHWHWTSPFYWLLL